MADYSDIKYHISSDERSKWDQVYKDFYLHKGAKGTDNHALAGDGIPGFSTEDFTTALKLKLISVQEGANNYVHPPKHPWTMIDGLTKLANTAHWNDIIGKPENIEATETGDGDSGTVGGIRITLGPQGPADAKNMKEIWVDTNQQCLKYYAGGQWIIIGAVYK